MSAHATEQNEREVHCALSIDDGPSRGVSAGTGQAKAHERKRPGSSSLKEQSQIKRRPVGSSSEVDTPQQRGKDYSFDGTIDGQAHVQFGDNIHNHYYDDTSRKTMISSEISDFQHLHRSLAFPRMGARERIVVDASPTTCEWLFEHQNFRPWTDDDKMPEHYEFLWIKGKPGTGKSTIMKRAKLWVDNMWSDQIVLSYFFNARSSDPLEKSTLGLWRSLVHQLLMVDLDSRATFLHMFASKISCPRIGELGPVEPWEEPELQNWLAETVCRKRHRPLPLNIFIDALDEGHDDEILKMVSSLEEIASRAATTKYTLRICLSSRHYPHIHIRHGLSLVIENQQGHNHDIEIYVTNHLRGNRSKEMDDLRIRVMQRSQGVTAMAEKFQELPKDLHDLFAALLSRVPEDIDEVATLLHWVLYSFEPITPDMLQIAITQTHQSPAMDPGPLADPSDVEIYLLNCSRGLIETVHAEDAKFSNSTLLVQFIHQIEQLRHGHRGGSGRICRRFDGLGIQ